MALLDWLTEYWLPLLFLLPGICGVLRWCWEILTGKG